MADESSVDALYQEVGRRIRSTRERSGLKLSQEKLAKLLKMSRASIVNIEAGRQHAPLHLLWQIAEALGTDLAMLIPRRNELHVSSATVDLDLETLRQIRQVSNGDECVEKAIAGIVSKLRVAVAETKSVEGSS